MLDVIERMLLVDAMDRILAELSLRWMDDPGLLDAELLILLTLEVEVEVKWVG